MLLDGTISQSVIPRANFVFTSFTSLGSAPALCLTGSLEPSLENPLVRRRRSPGGPAQLWFSSPHHSTFLM